MIMLPIISSAFQFASRVRRFALDEAENLRLSYDKGERLDLAYKVIEYMDQHSMQINVESCRGRYQGVYNDELQVSLIYWSYHHASQKSIEQHKSYCFDFRSWEELERDIHSLARTYSDIHEEFVWFEEDRLPEFWHGIEEFRRYAKTKFKESDPQVGRQP